jgi:hypothetical protein
MKYLGLSESQKNLYALFYTLMIDFIQECTKQKLYCLSNFCD